jgi:cytochrome c oxidase subunit IV
MTESAEGRRPPKKMVWLIYAALIVAGILFLADAFDISHLNRWTARLGIALMFSAFALIVGNGRRTGYVATAIIWLPLVAPLIYKLFS